MTSYQRAAENGRAASRVTNTSFKLRTIVEYREERREALWTASGTAPWGLLIGECGHTLKSICQPRQWDRDRVGKRMRCPQCPAGPPRPIPVDHCTYGIGGEFGERPCPTRARFIDPGYGLLCAKHHTYLLAGGYLKSPCPPYQRPPGPVQYLGPAAAPAAPELSPPVRGHLRLVQN